MTNWPNIQEYRNFEAKFIDDPKRNVLIDSAGNSDFETVNKNEYTANNADDFLNSQKLQNPESKIVRCVIKKDFEETFKKSEREDGVSVNHENPRPKSQEPTLVNRSQDKIRLQNHLKWKKQKEEEYNQKKEAERIAQLKKKEEEERLEKLKKQREKERIEKLKEWQEQKAKEKEEKKKERMMLKVLEEKLKVTPSVDKEKLIEEWVKLKNKQKQIEAEKKAELLKKEEESRALRQTLADLSYRQWKERVKGRMMTLPKNGYQIFGPKPVPVVKEDWNHDFIRSSPRGPNYSLRSTESCLTTTLTLSPAVKELDDFQKDIFYLGNSKTRSPSFCELYRKSSGLNLTESNEACRKERWEMPLKELQPGTIDLKKNRTNMFKTGLERRNDFTPTNFKSEMNFLPKYNEQGDHSKNHLTDIMCFPGEQGDQNRCFVSSLKKPSDFLNTFPDSQILPNKKKIDLYINTRSEDVEENPVSKVPKKKPTASNCTKVQKEEKPETNEKKVLNQTVRNASKEKFHLQNRTRSLSLQKFEKNPKESLRPATKKPAEQENVKVKFCRRSQSCDKPLKKLTKTETRMKTCASSKSMVKVTGMGDESRRTLVKSKTTCSQKRKSRKAEASEINQSKSEKKLWELDSKNKKKMKRKNSLSKSFSFIDSPYCAKSCSKTLNKVKTGRKKNAKDVETRSDDGGHCRKLSTTKV